MRLRAKSSLLTQRGRYVEGSLLDALRAYGEFSENLAASYVTQVLEGLSHLHQRGVVVSDLARVCDSIFSLTAYLQHCDLKCANILCTKSGNIKSECKVLHDNPLQQPL